MPIASKIQQLDEDELRRETYKIKDGLIFYQSKSGFPYQKMNGKATDFEGKKVVCRHLAMYVASQCQIKNYHDQLSSVESIQSIDFLYKNQMDREMRVFNATTYHIFPLEQFGSKIAFIAESLEVGQQKIFLLASENHLMAVTFAYKPGKVAFEKPEYVMKFYDPNKTTGHLRVLCDDLSALSGLSLSDLLTEEEASSYFPKIKTVALFSPEQRQLGDVPIVEIDPDDCSSGTFYSLLKFGLLAYLEGDISRFPMTSSEKDSQGSSGFSIALNMGHRETVKLYIETLLASSELDVSQKVAFLAAKDSNGYWGFYKAVFAEKTEVVKTYMETVLASSELDVSQKVAFLEAKDSQGFSAFHRALRTGKAEVVKTYMETVLASSVLTASQKVALLEAKDAQGFPGLYMALYKAHIETVKVYMETVLASPVLDLFQKKTLCESKDKRGFPGVSVAEARHHTAAVGEWKKIWKKFDFKKAIDAYKSEIAAMKADADEDEATMKKRPRGN